MAIAAKQSIGVWWNASSLRDPHARSASMSAPHASTMTSRDYLTALAITVVWGVNFVVIKIGVGEAPPLMLAALRFLVVIFPAIFFVKPPATSWRIVAGYGIFIAVLQFAFMFSAVSLGMPAGLTSLVVQSQMFFTMLAVWFAFGERPVFQQILGALVAFGGILVIASQRWGGAGLLPFLLVIGGAASWGAGNVIGKFAGRVDMLAFIVWSSLVAPLPLLGMSAVVEGRAAWAAVANGGWLLWGCVVYLAWLGTIFGYSLWARLLSRHSAAEVAPFSLLVPLSGMASARLAFGETASAVEWMGAGLVLAGLSWNVFGPRLMARALR